MDVNVDVEAVVGIVALAFAVACVIAGLYCRRVYADVRLTALYRHINGQAPFLTRNVNRNVRVATASGVLALLIAYSYLFQPLPRPWGAVVIGCCLVAFMLGPISDAWLWRKERRSPKIVTNEPWTEEEERLAGVK